MSCNNSATDATPSTSTFFLGVGGLGAGFLSYLTADVMLDERVEVGLKHSITLLFIVARSGEGRRAGAGGGWDTSAPRAVATAARGEVGIRVLLSTVASSD